MNRVMGCDLVIKITWPSLHHQEEQARHDVAGARDAVSWLQEVRVEVLHEELHLVAAVVGQGDGTAPVEGEACKCSSNLELWQGSVHSSCIGTSVKMSVLAGNKSHMRQSLSMQQVHQAIMWHLLANSGLMLNA